MASIADDSVTNTSYPGNCGPDSADQSMGGLDSLADRELDNGWLGFPGPLDKRCWSLPPERRDRQAADNGNSGRRWTFYGGAIALILLTAVAPLWAAPFPGAGRAYIAPPPGYHLNLRRGPGSQYAAVNTLRRGTAITLTGRYENGWAQLRDGSWVAGNWVQRDPLVAPSQPVPAADPSPAAAPPSPPAANNPPELPTQARIATEGGMDTLVFSGPGTEYDLRGFIPDGTVVQLTGQLENGWAELAESGWVYADWLAFD